MELHILLLGQVVNGVVRHGLVKHTQHNIGDHVHRHQVLQVGILATHVLGQEIRELTAQLHASGATSHNHKRQNFAHVLLLFLCKIHVTVHDVISGRLLQPPQDLLAQFHPVGRLLHEHGILVGSRDAKCIGLIPNSDNQPVVRQAELLVRPSAAGHLLGLSVHLLRGCLVVPAAVLGNPGPDWLAHSVTRDGAHGSARQHRGKEHVIPRGNHRDLVLLRVQALHHPHPTPAGSQDHHVVPAHGPGTAQHAGDPHKTSHDDTRGETQA
mmetsp:Transcript_8029/g.18971  ORF Transcript_8029/g.18971 Transcript_8029/m.18971 type:complete len:268 (+) Transcript_8029:673-1476(+)